MGPLIFQIEKWAVPDESGANGVYGVNVNMVGCEKFTLDTRLDGGRGLRDANTLIYEK